MHISGHDINDTQVISVTLVDFFWKLHDRIPVADAWILPQLTNHSDGSMLLTEGCILSVNSAISLRNVVRILICLHTFSLNAPQEGWDSNLAWSFLVSLDNLLQDVCFPQKLHFDHYLHSRTLGWCLGLWIGGFCTRGTYLAVQGVGNNASISCRGAMAYFR